MKLVAGILITLAALSSNAQSNNCNMQKVEKEARHFLVAMSMFDTRDIQSCLEIAIQKQLASENIKARNFVNERLAVLDVLAQIKQDKMAAQVKCESTDTPGCGGNETDESVLETDADLKIQGVEQERDNGTRDW